MYFFAYIEKIYINTTMIKTKFIFENINNIPSVRYQYLFPIINIIDYLKI